MHKTFIETSDRNTNFSVFSGKYIDKHDVDNDRNRKKKQFVPSAFRGELNLNHSDLIKKDSRWASVYSEITTKMAKANRDHGDWKNKISKYVELIGKLEIKSRILILQVDFCKAMVYIANGLVLVGKAKVGTSTPLNANEDIPHTTIHNYVKGFPEEVWKALPFVENSIDGVRQFCVELETAYSIKFNAMIEEKFKLSKESDNSTVTAHLNNKTVEVLYPDW